MDTMPCTGKRGDRHKGRWEYYMVHDKLWASKFSEFVIYRTAKLVWRGVALRVGVHYVHGKINLRVAVQFAEATSSYSTKAVCCCAHSEQLNVSRSRPGVPVPLVLYSHIARPQLGHGGG